MTQYFTILISLIFVFGLNNCQKKCDLDHIEGEVAIHLIQDLELLGYDCAIDESAVSFDTEPYISYDDLLSYDPDEYIFSFSNEIIEKLDNNEDALHQKAFAVVANGEMIYTCYFWLSYSSLSCDWLTTDPLLTESYGGLKIRMGYPGGGKDLDIPDRRNDERILCIFKRDGKLL